LIFFTVFVSVLNTGILKKAIFQLRLDFVSETFGGKKIIINQYINMYCKIIYKIIAISLNHYFFTVTAMKPMIRQVDK